MELTADTRLNKALELQPDVLDYVISLNPHDFARLRNPLMRRVMPPRITLGRIAAMTGTPLPKMLGHIATLAGGTVPAVEGGSLPQSPGARPSWVAADSEPARTVDLLPIDETLDADPLPPVMNVVKQLAPGEVMRFRHKWEPQPFYDLWTRLGGLEWYAEQQGPDEWWIWVRRVP
jgi:uncharacterized protein (DUF2249 family)